MIFKTSQSRKIAVIALLNSMLDLPSHTPCVTQQAQSGMLIWFPALSQSNVCRLILSLAV